MLTNPYSRPTVEVCRGRVAAGCCLMAAECPTNGHLGQQKANSLHQKALSATISSCWPSSHHHRPACGPASSVDLPDAPDNIVRPVASLSSYNKTCFFLALWLCQPRHKAQRPQTSTESIEQTLFLPFTIANLRQARTHVCTSFRTARRVQVLFASREAK